MSFAMDKNMMKRFKTIDLQPKEDLKEKFANVATRKVIVVGGSGVGKTSLIQRYVHNIYYKNNKTTIGVDYFHKDLPWTNDTMLKMQIWDIAGQERYSKMVRAFYREAVAAAVVVDLNNLEHSLTLAKKWKEDIDKNVFLQDGTSVPVVLVGNKADLLPPAEREVIMKRLKAAEEEWGFKKSFVSSAYSGVYVEDLFTEIGSLAMNGMPRMFTHATDSIRLMANKKDDNQCCLN
eukprot:TRINITY_DN6456_c0_g1_i1.p1 TRINITY_DN6456_c0_g1~~TRINITY_DN6456_c0_g1_i1.p1  ORF type:complete len:234 (+),score=30.83 TRINITY_DN6456_c0_g1_i1:214-915(+)